MPINPPDTESPLTATENLAEGAIVTGTGVGMGTTGSSAQVDGSGNLSLPAAISFGGSLTLTPSGNTLTMSGGKFAIATFTGFSGNVFECFFNGVSLFRVAASGDVANPGSCSSTGAHNARTGTTTPAGGGLPAFTMGASGPSFYWGSGPPLITAVKGSYYSNTSATDASDRIFVATDSSGNWTNVLCDS